MRRARRVQRAARVRWYLQYSMTLIRIFESTIGRGTGVSRPVSSTMFLTVTERQATSLSTSKTSSCFDLSFTDVASARARQAGSARRVSRTCDAAPQRCPPMVGRARERREAWGVRARAAGARVRPGGQGPAGRGPRRKPQRGPRAGAAVGAISGSA